MVVFLHQPDCLVSQSVGWFGQSVCLGLYIGWVTQFGFASCNYCWAKAPIKIARMTLTIKLDGNWSSFQLANSTPPLSVTDSAIAPSARMPQWKFVVHIVLSIATSLVSVAVSVWHLCV